MKTERCLLEACRYIYFTFDVNGVTFVGPLRIIRGRSVNDENDLPEEHLEVIDFSEVFTSSKFFLSTSRRIITSRLFYLLNFLWASQRAPRNMSDIGNI